MKKIDIYVNGKYVCSTTQARDLADAKTKFILNPTYMGVKGVTRVQDIRHVVCKYASSR